MAIDDKASPVEGGAGAPLGTGGPLPRLDSLTGLRFIAAGLVVIHHSVVNDVHHTGLTRIPALRPIATLGYTGVAFFFVLSGFVLAWSWQPARRNRDFWLRRVARVYPMHAVTWLLTIPVAMYVGASLSAKSAVPNLVLLQAWSPDSNIAFSMNSPSWSLSCEAFFYAMFPIAIWWAERRNLRGLLLTGLGAAAVLFVVPTIAFGLGGKDAVAIFYYFPLYRFGEFVIGVCLARAVARGWRPRLPLSAGIAAALGLLAITLAAEAAYTHVSSSSVALPRTAATLLMLPGYVILILAAALHDAKGARGWLSGRIMVRLGTWSFALYMTHLLLLQVIGKLMGTWQPTSAAASWSFELGIVLACIALSGVAYRLVEHPLERQIRRRFVRG